MTCPDDYDLFCCLWLRSVALQGSRWLGSSGLAPWNWNLMPWIGAVHGWFCCNFASSMVSCLPKCGFFAAGFFDPNWQFYQQFWQQTMQSEVGFGGCTLPFWNCNGAPSSSPCARWLPRGCLDGFEQAEGTPWYQGTQWKNPHRSKVEDTSIQMQDWFAENNEEHQLRLMTLKVNIPQLDFGSAIN